MSSVVAPYSLSIVEIFFQIFKIFGREFPANFVATAEEKKFCQTAQKFLPDLHKTLYGCISVRQAIS